MSSAEIAQRNVEATCYVGNLDEKVTEELLWELMLQVGPVVNVHMPKDKISAKYLGYGFVEYRSEDDADYAIKVMNMIKLYSRPLKVNRASQDKKQLEVGANIFVGNLDPDVDEKLLYDTFSAFGGIVQTPKILCDPETGLSKGYGFISYDSFESSDVAIECMNGQFLCNRSIVVQYAFKKDAQGERHGTQAERILAASQPQKFKPHTHFSGGYGDAVTAATSIPNPMSMYQQMDMQQMQMQMQMNYQHYQGMSYGQLPMQMQPPLPMMPIAPPSLPTYMTPALPIPPPPPMHIAPPPLPVPPLPAPPALPITSVPAPPPMVMPPPLPIPPPPPSE